MTTKTILVEDSEKIRQELIPALMELSNVAVIAVAEDATEAEGAFNQHGGAWQLTVVDLFLKGNSSGLTVLRACRNRAANQKVIVLTNYATLDMRKTCSELGADAVFDKSTELDAFFEWCAELSNLEPE